MLGDLGERRNLFGEEREIGEKVREFELKIKEQLRMEEEARKQTMLDDRGRIKESIRRLKSPKKPWYVMMQMAT